MLFVNDVHQALLALDKLSKRTNSESQKQAMKIVEEILYEVRINGDQALISYTEKFDGFLPEPIYVDPEELASAWEQTPEELQSALKLANERIYTFHKHQLPKDLNLKGPHGEKIGRRWLPVQKAGIYIPGGRASYPSTVLMNAIPAKVAGVDQLVMVSPGRKDGKLNKTVLAAAHLVGVNKVMRIGGAQAIAALAFGTETVPKVDVITGPGNLFVTLAKKSVYGHVGIDSLAGPSEVLIIADESARTEQVAADLLAQAEHDPLAASVLLTTSQDLAKKLPYEIEKQLKDHPRYEICKASLNDWGLLAVCKSIQECIELSNHFAPEHLELLIKEPHRLINEIRNAGAIFIGPWSPEAVGDYLAGPNHTLPTCGSARFSSALSVETFMRHTSLIEFNQSALRSTRESIMNLAASEGLHSHSESVRIRSSI